MSSIQTQSSPTKSASFVEEDKTFSGRYSREVFSTVRLTYGQYGKSLVVAIVIGVAARALLLFNTNVMGYWADSLCRPTGEVFCHPVPSFLLEYTHADFVQLLLTLCLVGFLGNCLFRILISRIGTHAVSLLYDEVTLRTSRLPMGFFDRTPVGRLVSRFSSDYASVFRMCGGPMGEFLSVVFDLCIMLILTALASPLYLPLIIFTVLLNSWVYRLNQQWLRHERRTVSVVRAPAVAHFAETVQGVRSIRVFRKAGPFLTRFKALYEKYLVQRLRTAFAIQLFSVQMASLTSALLFCTGLVGFWLVTQGWVSVGSVAVAFTFVMMTSSSVQVFFEYLANMEEAFTGLERLDEYFRRPLEKGALLPSSSILTLPQDPPKICSAVEGTFQKRCASVTFDKVSLRYSEEGPRALDTLSFTVEAGEHVGVIGRTGSGKTSLLQALSLLYPLESGVIKVDGKACELFPEGEKGFSLDEYRRRFSFIPQDPFIFRGTLRENITPETSTADEQLISILETVGLGDWMEKLSGNPLQFFIHERGGNLSAGQKQLIALARCLLQDSPVLVMDEATSNIDPLSEQYIIHATKEVFAHKTQIIVAHRLSTIESCHKLLWLEQGKLVAVGKPTELLPEYRKGVTVQ